MFADRDQRAAQECQDLFRSLGFSHGRRETEAGFERHLLEAKKFLVLSDRVAAEIAALRFFDNPEPERHIGDMIIDGGRVFSWQHRFWILPPNHPITTDVVHAVADNDFSPGFPLGIITNDASRVQEIATLGGLSESEFCAVVHLLTGGEIRLYTGIRVLPDLADADMN